MMVATRLLSPDLTCRATLSGSQSGEAESLALQSPQSGEAESLALQSPQSGEAESLALRSSQSGEAESLALRSSQSGRAALDRGRERPQARGVAAGRRAGIA